MASKRLAPRFITTILEAYGKVQPKLLEHEAGYPTANHLRALVKMGSPDHGLRGVGDGKDSEGSELIIQRLEQNDERPLWISVWGGSNTLAQALHKLRATCSSAELARLVAKLRVYTISDQDDTGAWLRREFPGLFYIVTPGDDYGHATWIAINNEYEGIDNSKVSNSWLARNIQQGHGPLGAVYPDVSWGMEGDTCGFITRKPALIENPSPQAAPKMRIASISQPLKWTRKSLCTLFSD